jgi:hypothetical protein
MSARLLSTPIVVMLFAACGNKAPDASTDSIQDEDRPVAEIV